MGAARHPCSQSIPGIINFLAIPVYTRLLSPAEYGLYILVAAAASFGNIVFFDWIRQSLLRFLPRHLDDTRRFLGNVLLVFLLCALAVATTISAVAHTVLNSVPSSLIWLGIGVMVSQAWFELNLELSRSLLKPAVFGAMLTLRAALSLLVGVLFIRLLHLSASAPLYGLLVGMMLATMVWLRPHWGSATLHLDKGMTAQMMRFGLPLTFSLLSTFLIGLSDRFLISYYLGVQAAGAYAASYDLVQQTVAYVMSSISMAVYPIVMRSVEKDGDEAVFHHTRQALSLLVAASAPVVAVLCIFASQISRLFLGREFHSTAISLMPWLAVSMLLSGIRAYYYDMAFQISRQTAWHALVLGIAALVNVGLNIWWIPRFGIIAAAYATFLSLLAALICSIVLGRKFTPLPVCWSDIGKVALALAVGCAAGLLLLLYVPQGSIISLIFQVGGCIILYLGMLVALNTANSRAILHTLTRQRRLV
ncbi:MAG: oligosaccharide flippase family protein [Armatimonadota bacterium]|nr:oligosaccharide flippase family protein [Armatimonadota bacterium]